MRVRLLPEPDVWCEARAEDHRGETYAIEIDCENGMTFEIVLCRHHVRLLKHTLVEV